MPDFDLVKAEEKILKFWEANKIFEKSQVRRKKNKKFVFYEGPPTANGLPHIGHFLTRAFKDLFARYKTMSGFFVTRRSGWDTHGLPVEIEVEKELGIKSKPEIEKYGIEKFNKAAKKSVWRYKTEWEKFSKRIGFWLDFDNPYITYNNEYIETLWWIIKQFDSKKLFYKGHKVLPWCPRCGTPLSSHEVALGYESISEDSVYVKFRILNSKFKKTYLLSWTTTPWTLPGNVALAVGKNIDYVVVERDHENLIVAKDLVDKILTDKSFKFQTSSFKGSDLVGLGYEPLFDIEALKSEKSYKVYPADFVNVEEGTGIVHTAVMYGEDDYKLGEEVGLPKHHTVTKEGKFTKDVSLFAGEFVKDAEKEIIEYLKNKGLLFRVEKYTHDYPFCWRCKTPLLYYAADSWFAKITAVKKKLIANNKKINWIPSYIKEGRFGQWLKEAKDWALSRNRYWGTPLPVWHCSECQNYLVIGSLEELDKFRYRKPNQYFILRHGQSQKNHWQGQEVISSKIESDKYDLTELGVKQTEENARELKKKKIDLIFASPFLRTKRTAEIISKELDLDFQIDERLKEVDHGSVCEGQPHFVCLPPEIYPPEDFNTSFGADGESWNNARERMLGFVKELDQKYEDKNILIVGHGDPLWLLQGIAENKTDKELLEIKKKHKLLKTGELKLIRFKNYPRDEKGNLDLHRPYIDSIFLKCSTRLPDGQECGGRMTRIPEVADTWFDSGSMPYAQAHFPFEQKTASIKEIDFPAEFICEGVDQTRGWFYTLLAVSTLLGYGPSYKNVISLGHVLDEKGRKMSKSLGNVITPDYAIKKFGSDVTRWWFYKVNQAGDSKSFREKELKEIQNNFVRVILNSTRFWQLYSANSKKQKTNSKGTTLLDKWLISRWNSLVASVTGSLDKYDATSSSRAIESFVIDDLSNWWIRRSRENFQFSNSNFQKQDLLRYILLELAKLIAPFTPFLAEYIHEEMHRGTKAGTESVHLHDWPKADKKQIDKKLEEKMAFVRKVVSLGLAKRKEAGIKVRQPLANLTIRNSQFSNSNFQNELADLIKEELNVQEVEFTSGKGELEVLLDTKITPALRQSGWVREFIRLIQDARKEAGYKYDQKVTAFWFSEDKDLKEAIMREAKTIERKTILKELKESRHDPKFVYDLEQETQIEPGRKIWLGVKR